jgi:hypothetical protein
LRELNRQRVIVALAAEDAASYISPGDYEEAVSYAVDGIVGWRATPGALDWLRSHAMSASRPKPARATRSRRT